MTDSASPPAGAPSPESFPNSARIWNYWLGGHDNYPVDRAVGDQVRQAFPEIVLVARAQRSFLTRAIRYLAGEAGMRQFLDIGAGLPTAGNTHEIAQGLAPESRIVYVDNDPLVLALAQHILIGSPEGATAYIDADVQGPEPILSAAARTLDFSRPVAVVLLGILGHIADDSEARSIIDRLMAGVAPGSHLVIADGVNTSEAGNIAQEQYNQRSPQPYHLRSPERVASLFAGLEIVDPGVVPCGQWRPMETSLDVKESIPADVAVVGGVGRKP